MGERDPGLALPAAVTPWAQRAVLVAALLALLVAVLVFDPVATAAAADAGSRALVTRLLGAALSAISTSRGPGLLGVLALAIAAAVACRSLERRVGPQAPLLVALLIFGSGCWALVWTDGAALAPLALAVVALGLAYGTGGQEASSKIYRSPETRLAGALRWSAVGLLLAELVPTGPLLAGLLLPAALAVPRQRRRLFLPLLLAGFAIGVAVELTVQGVERVLAPLGSGTWSVSLDPLMVGRGLMQLLVGRHVGVLLGFAPLLLLLALGLRSVGRPALAAVGLALPLLSVLLLPFDYAAGWLNLSFLAVYGALWYLPYRALRRWQWVAAVLLCGLATWPLWTAPRAALADGGGGPASAWPRRHLPYEATLRTLPNLGEARLSDDGPWLRAVEGCRLLDESGRFELTGAGPAVVWVAAPSAVGMVALEFGPGSPSSIEVAGAKAGRTVFRPDGRVGFEVLLDMPRARQRLWLGRGPMAVHLIEIRLPGWHGDRPLRFRLLATPQP